MFSCSHVPLSDLPPLLPWTVWRHKGKDSTNLKTNWNWPFPLDHLWYCSLAHRYLFHILPLFLRKRFDVIKCHTLTISSINSKKPVQPFIFLSVLLSTYASYKSVQPSISKYLMSTNFNYFSGKCTVVVFFLMYCSNQVLNQKYMNVQL